MPRVLHLLHQAVVGGDMPQPAAAKQIQAAVSGVRPVGQTVIPVNEQAHQRCAHSTVILNRLLFAENSAVRRLHIVANMLRIQVLVAIKAGNDAVAGQLSGNFAARQTRDAVTDDKAG